MRPRLFIIRGLPGSGKTTLGRLLAGGHVYANDDYFTSPAGDYNFVRELVGEAVAATTASVVTAMRAGVPDVAVTNVNSRVRYFEDYVALAERHGYDCHVITCEGDHGGVHGVADHLVERWRAEWEPWLGAV